MTEQTSITDPIRRRIGDRESRGFPPPSSAQPGSDEQEPAAEQAARAEIDRTQSRRQIIVAPNSSRNPGKIPTHNAGDPTGTGHDSGIDAQGQWSIGDHPTPPPAATGAPTSSVAVAAPAVREPTLDEPVIDTQPIDTQPEVEDAPAGAAPKAERPKRPKAAPPRSVDRLTRSTVLIGALIVVLLAATVFFGLKWRSQDNLDGLRSSALSSAKADGVLLSSYDYRNLTGPGSAWANVEKNATPAFRKNFLSTSGPLGQLLSQYNATATGKVISAGVASFSSSRAVVLLFIDQTVNNTVQKSASATQPLRTQVTVLHQNGRWLIDDLQVPK